MFRTIQSRMIGIFVGFLVLLARGVLSSYLILQRQADDGMLVNLAGRQRMLTQKMTKESVQLANAANQGNSGQAKAEAEKLAQTMRVFEITLLALKDGGAAPINLDSTRVRQSPAEATPEIRARLEAVSALWTPFVKQLREIITSTGASTASVNGVITEMPPPTQAKLLRALEQRTVRPVGGVREWPIHARLLGATNRDPPLFAHRVRARAVGRGFGVCLARLAPFRCCRGGSR